jgi:hypothetical protein
MAIQISSENIAATRMVGGFFRNYRVSCAVGQDVTKASTTNDASTPLNGKRFMNKGDLLMPLRRRAACPKLKQQQL